MKEEGQRHGGAVLFTTVEKETLLINVGEQIVSSYLKHIEQCDFVQTNVYTVDTQGEIDVVGICLLKKSIFICEVAIHLTTGMQYVKGNQPNNVTKIAEKLSRGIFYAKKYFSDYSPKPMLWSPIIRQSGDSAKNCQTRDVEQIRSKIRSDHSLELHCITNEKFQYTLDLLTTFAANETKDLKCPVMRFLQIQEYLKKTFESKVEKSSNVDLSGTAGGMLNSRKQKEV